MSLVFRKATVNDFDKIMEIIEQAKVLLSERRIPQWQGTDSPDDVLIHSDIEQGIAYVLEADGEVVATAALTTEIDAAYEAIEEGQWLKSADARYISLHRVAVDATKKNSGYARKFIGGLVNESVNLGYHDIRIDTHPDNLAMQKVIKISGFQYQGIVYLPHENGKRYAYQMII
ncbi:GNAT family N-acetyltransferase [Lactobacillus sp. CC-MHH1034]|uniref:GNAT family N-acetyltransferase n=1 Tax=Agrilactobacillus fermenti TaxID=2586909 RepID=UPI001E2F26FF|nr:GNAT family N-acetyltransferase [Agrilactobacillus fermenti]MCD2256513.1 GNAT family N-acetyltransferase [Agrilactobacillus fermenti]